MNDRGHSLASELTTDPERVDGNWPDIHRQSTTPGIPDPEPMTETTSG